MQQSPCSILYIGSNSTSSTSGHRADALRRIGCNVTVLDPSVFFASRRRWQSFIDYRTGYRLRQRGLFLWFKNSISALSVHPNLVWVDSGDILGPSILKLLKGSLQCPVILYNIDDPTGLRDMARFNTLLKSLKLYDFCALVRPETALESLALGSPRSLYVLRSFDEVDCSAVLSECVEVDSPNISFVGTLIPGEGRDSFLLALIKAGLPVRLRGNRWHYSRSWPILKDHFLGFGVTGRKYTRILRSSFVSLGLLSHQNRDLVTTRTFEVPACGGLLCAERTSEHQLLYEEGVEAVFWSTPEECIQKCKILLADSDFNQSIRLAGSQRVWEMGVGNEDICRQILASVA